MNKQRQDLRLACSVSFLALLAVTWKLWTPQTEYPRVPLLSLAVGLPAALDWVLCVSLLGGLIGLIFCDTTGRGNETSQSSSRNQAADTISGVVVIIACLGLFVLDQHRLQPWAFLFVCLLAATTFCSPVVALSRSRLLLISMYAFSGFSKLDFQFVHTVGVDFVDAAANLVGVTGLSQDAKPRIALAMPIAEIVIAAGLILPRTRTAGLIAVLMMHLGLIVLLSPWGLGHQYGVLAWNVSLTVVVWLLFRTRPSESLDAPTQWSWLGEPLVSICLIAVSVAPTLNLIDRWDHWLSWGLYAPSNSRVQLMVHRSAVSPNGRLGAMPQRVVQQVDPEWYQVHLDRWSIAALAVPIYPESRFQIGVALGVIERHDLASAFRLEIQSRSNRFSGGRQTIDVYNVDQLRMQMHRFRLNAIPTMP